MCAAFVLFSLLVGFLFLEETHAKRKLSRDPGRELGSWLLTKVGRPSLDMDFRRVDQANLDEADELMAREEQMPSSNRSSLSDAASLLREKQDLESVSATPKYPLAIIFNRQIVLAIAAYGILALLVAPRCSSLLRLADKHFSHTISFDQLLPVLLSMQPSDESVNLPFRFTGGFGLDTKTIGIIFSIQGIYQMAVQLLLFPAIIKRFGSLATLRFVAVSYGLLYAIIPYLVLLPNTPRFVGLGLCLVWKVMYQSLAYPSLALQLTNSAPSLLVLGTINGVAASIASLSRAVGPTFSGFVQSAGIHIGVVGLPWWTAGFVCLVGAVECLGMNDRSGSEPALLDSECKGRRDSVGYGHAV